MIIDPTCSIALEAEQGEVDVMRRPPRPRAQKILSAQLFGRSLLQGLLALAAVAAVFLWARYAGVAPETVRAVSFIAIVSVVLALLLVNRSFDSVLHRRHASNMTLLVLVAFLVGLIGILVATPVTRQFLRLAPLSWLQLVVAVGAGAALLLLLELGKLIRAKR
jgi:Ca2+-transporting ATPase